MAKTPNGYYKFRLDRTVTGRLILAGILANSLLSGNAAAAQKVSPPPSYAMVADHVTAASAIAHVRVRAVALVPPERAQGLPVGMVRYFVEADSIALIRGQQGLATRIQFLVDGPLDKKMRPVTKGQDYLIFGKIGARVDQFILSSSKAVLPWSQYAEAIARSVTGELLQPGAAPAVTGIDSAFHVQGAVTGESESQIFLDTDDGRPISLSVVRRPDQQPAYDVSVGEVVAEGAGLPKPDTLLWYRLACHLPAIVPLKAMEGASATDAQAAQRDYAELVAALGPCRR